MGREESAGTRVGRWAGERRRGTGCWTGPRGEEREERNAGWAWATWKKKREGKEKDKVGRAQREKEGEKELYPNAFDFEFEILIQWKTNNKTMQYGMKCTKPIFPYISLYS
jgi:hypothetical protein